MTDNEVIERALARKRRGHTIPKRDLLSSGSTLLNLGATGSVAGCYAKGHYYWFVGDSTSGKTWLALSCFAEAALNSNFDDYRYIYDNTEDGALMDIERFFGSQVAAKIEPPAGTRKHPKFSEITDDFYFNFDSAIEEGRPFIYVLDSMDQLETREGQEKFKEAKAARQQGKEAGGSYGMQKAKTNSDFIRRIVRGCRKTRSIVIIISQTRENVGFGAQFDPKRASGGKALKFYATLEIWTSIREILKKTIRGKKRRLGVRSKVQLKKNRITGKDRDVLVPIYHSIGVDDLGSCVDYLIEEKHWKGTVDTVSAPEFDFKGSKEKLIHVIEEQDAEQELRSLVRSTWDEIEAACTVKRKSRYT